jgi:hypothetical protein
VLPKGAQGAPPDDARYRTTIKEARAAVTAANHSRLALEAVSLQGPTGTGGCTTTKSSLHSRPRPGPVRSALERMCLRRGHWPLLEI